MKLTKNSLAGYIALAATLCLSAVVCQAQSGTGSAISSPPSGYPVDVDGAEINLGTAPFDGDLTITGANSTLVLTPGVHSVSGDVTINAKGDRILVGFDEKKQNGSLNVGGTLSLGPESLPTLALDLGLVGQFAVGEAFTIISAGNIQGNFSGLEEGSTFEVEDVKLRINYMSGRITITVVSVKRRLDRNYPLTTPVIEIDNSLIDPTSTVPGGW